MSFKETKLYGILTDKCPQCLQGKTHISSPYNLKKFTRLHVQCNKCGLKFTPEPSFYTGAMFISYGFSVGIVVTVFVIANLFYDELPIDGMIFSGISAAILLAPINMRLSRGIWLSIFTKYRPQMKEKRTTKK